MHIVSAVTITWNSADVIGGCLESLYAQGDVAGGPVDVVVVDNASTDGTVELIKDRWPGARVILNNANLGFAAAANQGITASTGEFVLLVNPDVSFGPGFIDTLLSAFEADPGAGSAAPKLLRPDGRVIDSAGLSMLKYRKAVDRGRDEDDHGQYDVPGRVFGGTGAAVLFRRAALEDARVMGEYFDEAFFAYKEDVDLAWRMNLLGWKCVYVPDAVGTHGRGWKTTSRKDVPRNIRRHSFKNHYLTILKNDDPVNMLAHLPWVAFYDLKLFVYALVREPFLFGAIRDIIKLMPEMSARRDAVMARRKVGPAGIRGLFG